MFSNCVGLKIIWKETPKLFLSATITSQTLLICKLKLNTPESYVEKYKIYKLFVQIHFAQREITRGYSKGHAKCKQVTSSKKPWPISRPVEGDKEAVCEQDVCECPWGDADPPAGKIWHNMQHMPTNPNMLLLCIIYILGNPPRLSTECDESNFTVECILLVRNLLGRFPPKCNLHFRHFLAVPIH